MYLCGGLHKKLCDPLYVRSEQMGIEFSNAPNALNSIVHKAPIQHIHRTFILCALLHLTSYKNIFIYIMDRIHVYLYIYLIYIYNSRKNPWFFQLY